MKDFFSDVFRFFVYLIAGILLGVLAFVILQYPVKIAFEGIRTNLFGIDKPLSSWILTFAQEAVGIAAVWILAHRTGYRENTPDAKMWTSRVLTVSVFACAVYVLMILLTNFSLTVLYQDTMHWMDLLYGHRESGGIGVAGMRGDYKPQSIVVLIVHGLLYSVPMNLGYFTGSKKRAGERAKLHHQ